MSPYPAYLMCMFLMIPAFALSTLVALALIIGGGPKGGWAMFFQILAFPGAGLVDPIHYGWRIVVLVAAIVFFLSAGAIAQLRTLAFHGLGLLGSLCLGLSLFAATREGRAETLTALFVLLPSMGGVAACAWFAAKFAMEKAR